MASGQWTKSSGEVCTDLSYNVELLQSVKQLQDRVKLGQDIIQQGCTGYWINWTLFKNAATADVQRAQG